jgi:pyridoxamine 5'-phosphate oxidase
MTARRPFPALHEGDLPSDPFEQFARWYELAAAEIPLAEAMTLATIGVDGGPDARMVLLKGHGPAASASSPTTRAPRRIRSPATGVAP